MCSFMGLKYICLESAGPKNILFKVIQFLFGLRLNDLDDAKALKDIKRIESIAISFNILPNGFAQDQSITPSRWTRTRSILYFSLMTLNIVNLILLCFFDLPQDLSLILGDFFYGHPSRRYFWVYWTSYTIFGEVLRHYWIYIYKKRPFSLHMCKIIFEKGFQPEALSMSQFYCHKYRFVASNLANIWIRALVVSYIGLGTVLIIIVQSVSQLPKTPQQFTFTYFWLLIHYFGIACTIANPALTGAIVTIGLSYFYFRASYVTQTVKNFVTTKGFWENRNFFSHYDKTIREIVFLLNETEYLNTRLRTWLIFMYLGLSFTSDFGFYSSFIIHIDHGPLDFFILNISVICLISIGTCSYLNGLMLIMMHSFGKNYMKVSKYFPSDMNSFIKFTDLQSRLSRNDIAFTIGQILDMTTRVFVIYLVENSCLIMMLIVNFK